MLKTTGLDKYVVEEKDEDDPPVKIKWLLYIKYIFYINRFSKKIL